MGARSLLGKFARRALGDERATDWVRRERDARTRLAQRVAPPPPPKKKAPKKAKSEAAAPHKSSYVPSDPFAAFPESAMSGHDLLRGLHHALSPRTYLEIGATGYVDGTPVDLAFIGGQRMSECALRDFMNTESLMAPTGVVVFDGMLPRNCLEAARDRRTQLWTGDVYKVLNVLRRNRPDLAIVPVNTDPTGSVVVVGMDSASAVLDAAYETELVLCQEPDPQRVPEEFLSRSFAVSAADLLSSPVWAELSKARDGEAAPDLAPAVSALRGIPRGR